MGDLIVYGQRSGDSPANRSFDFGAAHVLLRATPGADEEAFAERCVALHEAARRVEAAEQRAAERERKAAEREAEAQRKIDAADRIVAAMRARYPERPARVLGDGFVRVDPEGRMWMLGKREKGWASFGVVVDSWDDLFRQYDVRVVEVGSDEHGPFVRVTETPAAAGEEVGR